jgi:hypothetical protein
VNMHRISNILKFEYLLALELGFALGVTWKSIGGYDMRH